MIRILIAEDIDILREDIVEYLNSQSDIEVVGQANSAQQIIQMAQQMESDFILMDIEMEHLYAGIEATETIRDFCPTQKIVYLTAHDTQQMVLTAMATGAVDYIVKGLPQPQILQHIRSAFEGNPMLEQRIQALVLDEYHRLRRSEESLLFFIHKVSQLTATERELVRLLLQDKKVREIAAVRCVEIVTVKTQIKSLLHKFGCSRSKEVVNMVKKLNISHLF